MGMQAPVKEEFRGAIYDARRANEKLPCIQVNMKGEQDIGDAAKFGEAEKNALLVGYV
jgi:hypothetical protein